MKWDIEPTIIFESIVGSRLYGTHTPESDEDYRGVCIPPKNIRDGLLVNFEQKDGWENTCDDRVIYNIKKFFSLCMDANPAIIELLFSPEQYWITCKPPWIEIIDSKGLFISKKAKHTFTGYAHAQLKRIRTHRNWLLNPPKEEPTREDFGLHKNPSLSSEQVNAVLSIPSCLFIAEYREEAEKEKRYAESRRTWDMYKNWKINRNQQRAELEEKYGYDTKHAMHLVRLMREGEELLITGHITFPRPERYELQAIRNGLYSYDTLMDMVDSFDKKFEEFYERSSLPDSPDRIGVNDLYLKLIDKFGGK